MDLILDLVAKVFVGVLVSVFVPTIKRWLIKRRK